MRHTRSARKHRISRTRREQAIRNHVAVVPTSLSGEGRQVRMVLGDDDNGVALEIGVVYEDGGIVVIHAMELRTKFRSHYEGNK